MKKPNIFEADGYTMKPLYTLGYAEGYADCRKKLLQEIKHFVEMMKIECTAEDCIKSNKWDK